MSAWVRSQGERLRRRWASWHGVPLSEVEMVEFVNDAGRDDAKVGAQSRPDLPWWTLG